MREKFSTVTIGGVTFEYRELPRLTCEERLKLYRQHPEWTLEHERCDDAACEICDRVFGAR